MDAQNEYIANCDKRREFITGFTGSAGFFNYVHLCMQRDLFTGIAVVTMQGAWLWTDGRYHLQASQQLNPDLWTLMKQGALQNLLITCVNSCKFLYAGTASVPTLDEWISKVRPNFTIMVLTHARMRGCVCVQELESGSRIGFDPSLTAFSESTQSLFRFTLLHTSPSLSELHKKYAEAVECSGQILVPVSVNLVDLVWDDRPPPPCNPVVVLPLKYTGQRQIHIQWNLYHVHHYREVVLYWRQKCIATL